MHPRVAQFLAAIVVLSAAWLMPSLASAHAGHSHHAATEVTAPSAKSATKPADTSPTTAATTTPVARTEIARAATMTSIDSVAIGGEDNGCATHCCGAAT